MRMRILVICAMLLAVIPLTVHAAEITIASPFVDGTQEATDLDVLIANFEAANPDIKVVKVSFSGSLYYDKLTTMIATNTLTDIFYLNDFLAIPYHARGASLNLEPYITRDAAEVKRHDFWPLQLPLLTWNGEQRALPYDFSTAMLVCNKDIFENTGMALPGENMTWQDVISLSGRLTKYDSDGKPVQWAYRGLPWQWLWIGYFKSFGVDLIADDKVNVNNEKGIAAIQTVIDVVQRVFPPAGATASNQNVAMSFAGSWNIPKLNAGTLNYDIAYIPSGPAGKYVSATGGQWAINARSNEPEKAWRVLKMLASTESEIYMISRGMRSIPGRQSALPAWLETAGRLGRPANAIILGHTVGKYAAYVPPVVYYLEFENVLNKHMGQISVSAKQIPPAATIAENLTVEANAAIQEALANFNK